MSYFSLKSSLKHLLDVCVELLIHSMVLSELLVKSPLTGKETSSFRFNLTCLDLFGCGDDGLIHWNDCCFPLQGVHHFVVSMVCSMCQVVTTHLEMIL